MHTAGSRCLGRRLRHVSPAAPSSMNPRVSPRSSRSPRTVRRRPDVLAVCRRTGVSTEGRRRGTREGPRPVVCAAGRMHAARARSGDAVHEQYRRLTGTGARNISTSTTTPRSCCPRARTADLPSGRLCTSPPRPATPSGSTSATSSCPVPRPSSPPPGTCKEAASLGEAAVADEGCGYADAGGVFGVTFGGRDRRRQTASRGDGLCGNPVVVAEPLRGLDTSTRHASSSSEATAPGASCMAS